MDGSEMDDGRVAAAVVSLYGDGWTVFHSHLGTGRMEEFNPELSTNRVTLGKSVASPQTQWVHRVTTVALFRDSQADIRRTALPDPGPWQHLARVINKHARALCAVGIEATIH